MGYEEFVVAALARGKPYDQLPGTLQAIITQDEYHHKVKEYWIGKGAQWAHCPAKEVCFESEYYESLIKSYKAWMRVFPHHLAGYISRVMRVTPFKYYSDLMVAALVAERPYHQLPNFTAADAMRVLGIGRNEYIATLNACKGRRLLWRVNRTSVARELLPTSPLDIKTEPWWRVACVNLGEGEFRELDVDEMAALKSAGLPGALLCAGDLPAPLLQSLWRKGLIYLEVPVSPTDRYTIPPLEGFVSNKDAAQPLGSKSAQGTAADPLEALLYAIFVANSERLTVHEVAEVLGQNVGEVCTAISMACRLGFATRIDPPSGSSPFHRTATDTSVGGKAALHGTGLTIRDAGEGDSDISTGGTGGPAAGLEVGGGSEKLAAELLSGSPTDGRAVAVVLDAEATSFLMMGALSPGLKRHAVTLFEGGRVAGDATMSELTSELWASHAEGQAFEGDMARLAQFAGALASVLDVTRACVPAGCAVELLRKESLAGLQPAAAAKVLSTAYCALLPVTPLPHPPLPLLFNQSSAPTAYFGPSAKTMSPWAALSLYSLARCGPTSLVLCCGQRLSRLPSMLQRATHALVWCWDVEQDGTRAKASGLSGSVTDGGPSLVEAPFLLFTLNELLARTAVMIQPLNTDESLAAYTPPVNTGDHTSVPVASNGNFLEADLLPHEDGSGAVTSDELPTANDELGFLGGVVDIPIPLPAEVQEVLEKDEGLQQMAGRGGSNASQAMIQLRGVHRRTSHTVSISVPKSVISAVQQLGLGNSVGMLRVAQLPGQKAHGMVQVDKPCWLPLSIHQGLPLYCLPLCKLVCAHAQTAGFLMPSGQAKQVAAQQSFHKHLDEAIALFGTPGQSRVQDVSVDALSSQKPPSRASYGVVPLPVVNVLFDGVKLQPCDMSSCVQGAGGGLIFG